MTAMVVIVGVIFAFCIGAVGGAFAARWAITAPHYKERWQSALRLVEQLDEENTRLHDGQLKPGERIENRRLVDHLLGRRPKPLRSLTVAEIPKRPKRPTEADLARILRAYKGRL